MVNLFIRALRGGAVRQSLSSLSWHIAGNCEKPYFTEVVGRPCDDAGDLARPYRDFTFTGGKMTMRVELWTRCRHCTACKQARANEWRYRAREELRRAARTWWGTLTLSPVAHYRVLCEARRLAATRAVDWSALSVEERFKRVANTGLKEVTRYVKRVRKQSKVPLRYICVTEKHKSGLPHFHMLVHEVELKPVTHKILSSQWTYGFEKWRLVPHEDVGRARYVTKYLTKAPTGIRIRASEHYGKSIGTVGPVLTAIRDYDLNRNQL